MTNRRRLLVLTAAVLLLAVGSIVRDVRRHRRIPVLPDTTKGKPVAVYDDLVDAHHGRPVDWANLEGTLEQLEDFRMAPLIRILYRHSGQIDPVNLAKIQAAVLNLRYWMDQPGEDGHCYWSENHQILYASAEYLAGQKFADQIFTRDGRSGRAHLADARRRVLTWLEQRWQYGFAEWYSNVYYVEDVAPLCNLIDFAQDEEIVTKSKIILDVLLYDVATQSLRGTFLSTMGRAYQHNRMSGERGNSMRGIVQAIWDFGLPVPDGRRMDGNFLFREQYRVPAVIEAIGRDTQPSVIRASQGLDLAEFPAAQAGGDEDARIMLQWGAEAFTNPAVVNDTLRYVEKHRMFSNSFLHELRTLDFFLIRQTGLAPVVTRLLDPWSNATVLQRANTYTYRTPAFLLASAQRHHPGALNDQQHLWSATLSNQLSIFTAHPPPLRPGETPEDNTKNYWVGPGRMPHAAQHENVLLAIYRIPKRTALGERGPNLFTHAYFPKDKFQRVIERGPRIFGRHGDTYAALIGGAPLAYRPGSTIDLLQEGRETFWICELGSKERDGDFDAFVQRVGQNPVTYRAGRLGYRSGGRELDLDYGRDFRVNGIVQDPEFARHDSPYARTPRRAETMTIEFAGRRLFLDFAHAIRREN